MEKEGTYETERAEGQSQAQGALMLYADREDIKELEVRIEKFLPGTRELPEAGRLALAQVAISMGLNPFLGEIWAIPQKRNGKVIGWDLMTGIKGLRRAARNQGHYTISFRNLTSEDRNEWGIKDSDIATICRLYRVSAADREIFLATKQWPWIEGVGIWRQGEKTKMQPIAAARKRAEADALKQAFDLPLSMTPENGRQEDFAPPGEYMRGDRESGDIDDLFPDDSAWDSEVVEAADAEFTDGPHQTEESDDKSEDKPEPATEESNGASPWYKRTELVDDIKATVHRYINDSYAALGALRKLETAGNINWDMGHDEVLGIVEAHAEKRDKEEA